MTISKAEYDRESRLTKVAGGDDSAWRYAVSGGYIDEADRAFLLDVQSRRTAGPAALPGPPATSWVSGGTTAGHGLLLPPAAFSAAEPPHRYDETPLDLDVLWNTEPKPIPPYQGGLLRPGQQASLWGGGKVGKSLFVLEWSLCLAAGLPFLGDEPTHGQVRVLYVDRENGQDDIHQRLHALGTKPDPNLVYLSFPATLGTFDVEAGAAWLERQVDRYDPQLVVIDTASRFIEGDENDNRTWHAFYRLSLAVLKKRGVASLRIDHSGHQKPARRDEEPKPPMPRGASGKTQDIDEGWAMWNPPAFEGEVPTGVVRLTRVVTRSGLGRDEMLVQRAGRKVVASDGTESWARGGTGHSLSTLQPPNQPRPTVAPTEPWTDVASVVRALVDRFGSAPPSVRQAAEPAVRLDVGKAAGWRKEPTKSVVEKALRRWNRNLEAGRVPDAEEDGE